MRQIKFTGTTFGGMSGKRKENCNYFSALLLVPAILFFAVSYVIAILPFPSVYPMTNTVLFCFLTNELLLPFLSISPLLFLHLVNFIVSFIAPFSILINFSVASMASVFSVANKSSPYINEMQPSVFLPVYFSYNHRTLYRTTSERIEATFHFFLQPSKLVMAYLDYPLCNTQTLSCKAKVVPIV